MAGYNRTRYVEQLLEKTESLPPSFTVHLHPEYWVLNNGSKFLYHNQIASLLDDIRAQRIPVDFLELFDAARVPFYDGCMVVELLDYRPQRSKEPALKVPERTRVVLHPNSETLWADICLMNRRIGAQWTDKDALEVEAKILLATSQPLCLDPDPHLTRIVNSVLRMSTPTMPPSLKRKAAAMEPEEDGPEKARRSRILSFMAPQNNKSHMPSYRILDALSAFRLKVGEAGTAQASQTSMAGHQYMNGAPLPPQSAPQPHSQLTVSMPTPPPVAAQGASPMDVDKSPQKADTTPLVAFNVPLPRTNGSNTPLPPQPTHQFVNQHPPPNHPAPNGMQPQVYPSVQAATEAAKKPATPAQQHAQMQHYIQHYQQQQQQSHSQNQPRPPSQPQHPQQLSPAHQQPQQHFTQSPKLPAQSNATSPALTQPTSQPFPTVQPTFQPSFPHSHFLQQPPPGGRSGPGIQPTNQQALSFQQQQQQNANFFLHQQRMAMAANVHMVAPNQGVVTGSPTVLGQTMTSSPQASGRPITPALAMASGDGKQQQSGQVQGQMQNLLQQPLRRQTPQQQLQGQLAVARAASQSQSPHTPQAQVKQQTPQLANRTPHLQQRTPQQQLQQIQNQQPPPQTQVQAQAQSRPQSQPQSQPTQPQQQQIPGHPHYAQYSYQMPGTFWQQRSMQGISPQQQLLFMQQAQQQQQQQQVQQSQQQQSQPQAQQQQVSQSIIVDSSQQPQGSVPVMAYGQKLASQQHQQSLVNMNRMGGKGKVGQKKPKRGGGAGR